MIEKVNRRLPIGKTCDSECMKQLLSDKLIESDNPDAEIFNKLTEEDIRDLLAFENKQ